jgi:uncharacterized protein (UPF0332 family)
LDPFEDCLKKGRLRPVEPDIESIKSEILIAHEELSRAQTRCCERRYEDCLVQSYFAMFRAARALLRHKGYKDTNLYSLIVGLRRLYVDTGDLEPNLVNMLSSGKEQKDLVYEGARCNPRDTRALLRNSEVFFGVAVGLLGLENLVPARPAPEDRADGWGRADSPDHRRDRGDWDRRSRAPQNRKDEGRPPRRRETRTRRRS